MTPESLVKHFTYLDRLRESGKTNMWGSSLYLQRAHKISSDEASKIVGLWMHTFDPDKSVAERAALSKGK